MNTDPVKKALGDAIDMEKKGFKFYAEAAEKSVNAAAKKAFKFLAESEKMHIESIERFYTALKMNGTFPDMDLDTIKRKRAEGLEIFAQDISQLKDKISPDDEERNALEFAMKFEKSGYAYYENMLKGAVDEGLVKLLKFLISEEGKHYDGLMKAHTYMTDPENWFMYEEGPMPQG